MENDLHKKFGFLPAGIPKGNSWRIRRQVEFEGQKAKSLTVEARRKSAEVAEKKGSGRCGVATHAGKSLL